MDTLVRKVHEKIQRRLKRSGGGSKYFSGARRGEDAEIQADVNSGDLERQKGAVKRVIASMTLGREVSHLFVDIVKLSHTTNLELKKLVYLYVLHTAKLQPEKALMAVNTFLQDTTSPSPVVRALAVRTMLCVRVPSVVDYTLEPLRRALVDTHPYVRKTAVMGLGKIFHHSRELFREQGFAKDLITHLSDPYPIVVANAAAILHEVQQYGGALEMDETEAWVGVLLRNLPESTEWGQLYILELLSTVQLTGVEVAESILARVLPRLSHANPAVVMGAIKVMTHVIARCEPGAIARCVPRVRTALISLAHADPETQYVVCRNIHALLVVFPSLRQNLPDAFFVRFNDPPYVKVEKLRLLVKFGNPHTAARLVKELRDYLAEVDPLFLEAVIATLAALAIKVKAVAVECGQLLTMAARQHPELLPQVITAAKLMVRCYPDLPLLGLLLREHGADTVTEEEAKVSLAWMLGEEAPDGETWEEVLQTFVDTLMRHEPSVQLAVLTTVVKRYLRDPTTTEERLRAVLETLTSRSADPDVRDRAFAYCRLLSKGMEMASMRAIVQGPMPPVNVECAFSDAMTVADLKQSINTAAAVFGEPPSAFLPPYGRTTTTGDEEDEEEEEMGEESPSVPPPVEGPLSSAEASPVGLHVDPLERLFGTNSTTASAGSPRTTTTLDDLFA